MRQTNRETQRFKASTNSICRFDPPSLSTTRRWPHVAAGQGGRQLKLGRDVFFGLSTYLAAESSPWINVHPNQILPLLIGSFWPVSTRRYPLKMTQSSKPTWEHDWDGVYQWTAEST